MSNNNQSQKKTKIKNQSKTSNNNPLFKFEIFSQSFQTSDAEAVFKLL